MAYAQPSPFADRMSVAAMLAWRAIVVRAAGKEANLMLALHLDWTVEIGAAPERAHAAAAFLRLLATEADAAFGARSACATEPTAAAVGIETALIVVARIVVAATEQHAGEQRARGEQ